MVDDHDTTSSPDAGRPRRPPPTIELKPSAVSQRPPAEAAASGTVASGTPSSDAASPEVPPSDAPTPGAATAEESPAPFDTAPSDMPPPDIDDPSIGEPTPAPRRRAPVLIPALAGATAAAVVVGGAWLAWQANNPSRPADAAVSALAARVASVEARPLTAPNAAIASRIDALEKSVASMRSEITAAKSQAERAAAAANDAKSGSAAAPAVDLAPITQRLGQIERTTGDLKTAAAQQNTKPADDAALRRVVAASLLDTSVRQGEPYAAALAAVKPLTPDAARLQPLEAFAATGLPGPAALSRDLLALLPRLSPAESAAPSGGYLDRLQVGATRLLHIQRIDAVAGDDRSAVVSRANAAAQRNDVATARRELGALPAADRGAVQPWIDKVDAREAALAASRQFAADAMAALNKPAP